MVLTVNDGLANGPTFAPLRAAFTQSAAPFRAAQPDTLTLATAPLGAKVTTAPGDVVRPRNARLAPPITEPSADVTEP